jgi:phospholipase D1/2
VDAVLRAAREDRKFRVIVLIPAVPGFAGDLREDGAIGTRAIMDYQYKSICRGEHSIFGQIEAAGVDPRKYLFFFNLRSYDRLNRTSAIKKQESESGVKYAEVQRAQAEEIMGEGIHGTADFEGGRDSHMGKSREQSRQRETKGGELQENLDEEHRPDEVVAQMDAKRRFEDAADGEPGGPARGNGDTGATVAHHAMAGQGPVSEVSWEGDAEDEVNHWIQEELYIHAKLLIVDDRVVLCGSSNLNDRSQLGYHDSELSIVMEDTRRFDSVMDGKPFQAGWHAATLRRYLWREHLGLLPPQEHDASDDPNAQPPGEDSPNDVWDGDDSWKVVEDPLGDELWEMWTERASTNTQVFRQLFHADPDDHGELGHLPLAC